MELTKIRIGGKNMELFTDKEIDKIVDEYSNRFTNAEWSRIGGVPHGFANGMKLMRDRIYIRLQDMGLDKNGK